MLSEMLAVIESMDPTTIPLWLTTAAAAAMYPMGLMLGSSCSPCCSPCGCPPGERLPDALVVSFSGLTKSATKTENLLALQTTSCFGGGAAGTVSAPHGLPGQGGAISEVTLTSGGSGYAVLGRVQPTGLSINAAGGTGAEFSITLAQSTDECSLPYWAISEVTVTKAGEGYNDNQSLSVSLGANEFESLAASLTLRTTPSEPTISATVTETDGVGLDLSVTQTQVASSPDRWGVSKVSVSAGGSGYGDKQPVAFSVLAGETTVSSAVAVVRVTRVAPAVVAHYYGAGTGATFTPTLTKTTFNGDDVWEVASVSVTGGGTGYANNQNVIFFSDTVGEINDVDSYWKIVTNGSGVVTSLTKTSGGRFWAENGIVDRVEVSDAGSYYGDSTSAASVTVNDGGRYYKERSDIPAHVAAVTASVSQTAPSAGAGAEFSVTVDDNPASATFGQVTAVSLANGGSGYLEWSYTVNDECCITAWNGNPLYVERISPTSCDYQRSCCERGTVYVRYNGPGTSPTVRINGDLHGCGLEFTTTTASPYSCDDLTFSAEDVFGTGTASVSPASGNDNADTMHCPGCCSSFQGDEPAAKECTQEDCVAAGHSWKNRCECDSCNPVTCAEGVELVVSIESVSLAATNNGQWIYVSKNYTLTLTAENEWSDSTPGFHWGPFGVDNGAYAIYNLTDFSSDYAACTMYVVAHATDPSAPNVDDALPGFCTQGFSGGGAYGRFEPAGFSIPFANGCFVDGAEVDCVVPIPAPGEMPGWAGGARITVTLVTP